VIDTEQEHRTSPVDEGGRGTAARAFVITAAVLAVLLLGAAVGLLVKLPGSDSSAPAPAAGSVDVGFAQDMSTHHLQGVQMANIARDQSADLAVRQLAFDIASTQLEQVGRMKGWLSMWGQPEQSPTGEHMGWMSGDTAHAHGSTTAATGSAVMPGMATSDELAKLRGLSGTEFDVYFLQLMLRHHEGGSSMAAHGADHAAEPVLRNLADNMLKSQASESEYMKSLLTERNAQPL
jgi:uncharacterized protein (DUF305 family)